MLRLPIIVAGFAFIVQGIVLAWTWEIVVGASMLVFGLFFMGWDFQTGSNRRSHENPTDDSNDSKNKDDDP